MGSYLDKPIVDKNSHSSEAHGLEFGVASMQGWRVEMEDAHTIIETIEEDLDQHSFLAVYDGHGGVYSAIYCGQHMIDFLKQTEQYKEYKKTNDVKLLEGAIKSAYLDLDKRLKTEDEFTKKQDTSGCTAVCAIITPTHIVVGNAGDSRAVVYYGGSARALSKDHKPMLEEEKRRIEEAGGSVTMGRVDGDLALSRSIGDFQYKDEHIPPEKQKVTAFPDVAFYERSPDDELLVLACDGVWDVCSNEDVYEIVKSIVAEGETSLKLICEEVLDQCLERNSKDNISAVVVAFPPLKAKHYKEGQGVMGRRRRKDDQEGGRDGGDLMDSDERTDK